MHTAHKTQTSNKLSVHWYGACCCIPRIQHGFDYMAGTKDKKIKFSGWVSSSINYWDTITQVNLKRFKCESPDDGWEANLKNGSSYHNSNRNLLLSGILLFTF